MKIFKFEWRGGETDWVFALDKEDAIEFYLGFTGNFFSDLERCNVDEVPEEEWNENYILDIDEIEPNELDENACYNQDDYHYGYKISETFADYAKRNTQTDMIATTEF